MSSINSSLSLSSLRPALPIFTGLLGVVALGGGAYNFVSPLEGAKGFGLLAPAKDAAHADAFQEAYIRVHGIRNIGTGLSTLTLVLMWQFSDLCRTSPIAALAVKRCMGISLVLGTTVGLGDAWILKQYAESPGVGQEAVALARGKSTAHAVTALVIASVGLGWLMV
ncbi:uncharacterized protein HMPREF1541_01250 [Cyphellophora europaea CBS 101466]|uniref:Uncharacterized protein n=1 Tax=Cyphellophora europaea (strain CBS 101466) TaxID=1220924 RepID=W2SEK7_CYPE1|nr:uncharacterized protein HMPREF1541_01250 [Cyphellophora europaea CBS 101466]ETN47060.1 hypothetical protein HMPREF1541_01250 [Cyphellophora europaea CBS 101466]